MAKERVKSIRKKYEGIGIRGKLLFWLLVIVLLPIAVSSYFSYHLSAKSLYNATAARLTSTLQLQKVALRNYFIEREKNLDSIADGVDVSMQRTYAGLAAVKAARRQEVLDFIQKRKRDLAIYAASSLPLKLFQQLEKADANPISGGGVSNKSLARLQSWMAGRNIKSLLMLRPDSTVLYATDGKFKPGLKIKKDTVEREALRNGLRQASFTGFGRSPYYQNKPVCYFSVPFRNGGKKTVAVLLFRMGADAFDDIMQNRANLGKSGESYLVGPDGMFRSNSRFFQGNTVMNPSFLVDTESVAEALLGIDGEQLVVNYRGEYVLSSFMPLEIGHSTWALIVEINQHEAIAPNLGSGEDSLQRLASRYGFPNLYLVDPDGYMFYAVHHQSDFQTNLITGPYAQSGLARTILEVLDNKRQVVSDYSIYEPAGNRPAAFLAKPIMREGEVSLIVAFQIPIDQINSIMRSQGRVNGGRIVGDSYLVGPDRKCRTQLLQAEKYKVKSTILNPKLIIDNEAVKRALAGDSGTRIITNKLREEVLASWSPFTFKDLKWALISEVPKHEIEKPISELLVTIGLLALLSILIVAFVGWLVAGGITRQVEAIVEAMTEVEEGNYETQAKVTSKDELGFMAQSFNEMINTIRGLIKTRQNEHDQLQASIMELLVEIDELSDGNMTVRATVREDATGTVADSLNMMLEKLGGTIAKIKKLSEEVGVTASKLSSSTDKLAIRSDAQAELVTSAVNEINQVTAAIREVAEQASRSAVTSTVSATAATDGANAVEDTSKAMEAIRSNIQNTARAIKRLGESSQEISDFVKNINDISDRTSILALNASIQAATAGEEGRGFAVVADEIQRLAERTSGSTKQIEGLIKNILNEISDASTSMDASIQEVVQGSRLSEGALRKLREITEHSTRVAELIEVVSKTTTEQAEHSLRLAGEMDRIGTISMQTASETRETSSAMRDMADLADEMLQSVTVFRLPGESGSGSVITGSLMADLIDDRPHDETDEGIVVKKAKVFSPLVAELQREHEVIFTIVDEIKTLDLGSKEIQARLLVLKNTLVAHLKKEDEQFYPSLWAEAQEDLTLKEMLSEYAADMAAISSFALEFCDKFAEGGSQSEFERDFENLYDALTERISSEESILFEKYNELYQQGRVEEQVSDEDDGDEGDDAVSLKDFLASDD